MRNLLIITLILLVPSSVFAQMREKKPDITYYLSGFAGASLLHDGKFGSTVPATNTSLRSIDTRQEYDLGFGGGLALGMNYRKRIRIEIEAGARTADLDQVTARSGTTRVRIPVQGDITTPFLMVNGAWDFINKTPFVPYIGGGVGAAFHDVSNPTFTTLGVTVPASSNHDAVLAYQATAGVGYKMNEQTTIFAGYRYFSTEDPEFRTTTITYDQHNLELGFRYYFDGM